MKRCDAGLVATVCILIPSLLWGNDFDDPDGKEVLWEVDAKAGYAFSRGNFDDQSIASGLFIHRKTGYDEWTHRLFLNYSERDGEVDDQRYGGLLRYAFSFGRRLAWYNFYKAEGDHDRAANVDRRLVPSTGVGYWFSDLPTWKAMVELGVGWERVRFRDKTEDRSDLVLVPRFYLEKNVGEDLTLSEDFIAWSRLTGGGETRFRSETKFTDPLFAKLSLEIQLVNEYNSDPAGEAEKNDLRLLSSLVYSF